MASSINAAFPQQGAASTANVRSNFASAITEIEALQDATGVGGGSGGSVAITAGTMSGVTITSSPISGSTGSFTTLTGTTIDGAIGSVTPAAGTFTTVDGILGSVTPAAATISSLSTTGQVTFNDAGADVDFRVESTGSTTMLGVDAGNDVLLIGGNVGIQVTPESDWQSALTAVQIGGLGAIWGNTVQAAGGATSVSNNCRTDGANYMYIVEDETSRYTQINGTHDFFTAVSGAQDDNITWGNPKLRIEVDGTLNFGSHSAIGAETVTGFITIKDSAGTSRKLAVVS